MLFYCYILPVFSILSACKWTSSEINIQKFSRLSSTLKRAAAVGSFPEPKWCRVNPPSVTACIPVIDSPDSRQKKKQKNGGATVIFPAICETEGNPLIRKWELGWGDCWKRGGLPRLTAQLRLRGQRGRLGTDSPRSSSSLRLMLPPVLAVFSV